MVAKNAGFVLYGVFKKMYREAHADKPPALRDYDGNIYRDSAMLKRVAEDVGEDVVTIAMEYYFAHRSSHDVREFVYSYDRLLKEMDVRAQEEAHLEKVRERTRQRLDELGVEL